MCGSALCYSSKNLESNKTTKNIIDSINNFESKKVKIQVYKPGVGSFIFKFAHNFSFMYGLFSAIIAISLGLSAGLIFRKYL